MCLTFQICFEQPPRTRYVCVCLTLICEYSVGVHEIVQSQQKELTNSRARPFNLCPLNLKIFVETKQTTQESLISEDFQQTPFAHARHPSKYIH